jgi:hypothetical protein
MKTPYEILENLRKAETILLNARYDVFDSNIIKNTTASEYMDLRKKIIEVIGQAKEFKNNLESI